MATRLYLPSSGTSPMGYKETGPWEDWDAGSGTTLPCYTTKQSTAMTTITNTRAGVSGNDTLMRQWWSPPLTVGQVLPGTGTMSFVMRTQESNSLSNVFLLCTVGFYVAATEGFWSYGWYATTESATTLVSRFRSGGSSGWNHTTAAGDRICVQIGYQKNSTTSYTQSFRIGDAAASDLTLVDGTSTDNNPWVEISDTVTFTAEPAGSNSLMMMGCGT